MSNRTLGRALRTLLLLTKRGHTRRQQPTVAEAATDAGSSELIVSSTPASSIAAAAQTLPEEEPYVFKSRRSWFVKQSARTPASSRAANPERPPSSSNNPDTGAQSEMSVCFGMNEQELQAMEAFRRRSLAVLQGTLEAVDDDTVNFQLDSHLQDVGGVLGNVRNIDDTIFDMFKNDNDLVSVAKFLTVLKSSGLKKSDPRLREALQHFQRVQRERMLDGDMMDPFTLVLDRETFKSCIHENIVLITRALRSQFVIPDWPDFCRHIEQMFLDCKAINDGKVADYIPQLARSSPNSWGLAICTVDGQRASWGDSKTPWCLQSVSKPLTYGIALNDSGTEMVHKYIGQEPSGRLFNEICLDHKKRPHNPMINAGAIVTTSLVKPDLKLADRFDYIIKMYKRLAGGEHVSFSNTTFLSERETADRNFALAYYMREHKCFPDDVNLNEILDLYFQLCSVEVTCESASVIAATLANGGVCPMTGETVLSNQSVRDVLSLMYSCGMYDYSGQFAFRVGLPAKSGVSGSMILVIPNVVGFALWSPPLDRMGNTVRGVHFCEKLIERFNFHNYDSLNHGDSDKIDPRKRNVEMRGHQIVNVLFSAANGDIGALRRYVLQGVNMDAADYDGRTALHVAASEGHPSVVRFLLYRCNVRPDAKDRWNNTPLDDTVTFKHPECQAIIEEYMTSKSQGKLAINGHGSNDGLDRLDEAMD